MSISFLKKLAVVATILVAVWVYYLYHQVPRRQFPFETATDKAQFIVLEQGPKKVTLKKDGSAWKVGPGNDAWFSTDDNQTKTLVASLKSAEVEDEISDRPDRASEFEVAPDNGMHVTLLNSKNAKLAEGIFGKQAPDFQHIYFKYVDRPDVYLARGIIRGDLGSPTVNAWRNKQILDVPETKIGEILVEGKGFKTDLIRKSTDSWTANGKAIDPNLVNVMVGQLAHLKVDDFADPTSTSTPTVESLTYAKVNVKAEGAQAELAIGPLDKNTKRYPVSTDKDQGVAWVSQYTVDSLLKKPTDFKKL